MPNTKEKKSIEKRDISHEVILDDSLFQKIASIIETRKHRAGMYIKKSLSCIGK